MLTILKTGLTMDKNGRKIKLWKYLLTVLICVLGFWLKLYLIKHINYPEGGFLISTAIIMISAWYGGFGTGLLATLINYLITDYFFITPKEFFFHDSFADQFRFTLFIAEGILISWLFESLHRSHQKTKEALYQINLNEKLFRSLIENIKDHAIFMVDAKGNIRTWNHGATQMTGYQNNEIIDKPLYNLSPLSNNKESILIKNLKLAKKRGQFRQEGWQMRKGDSLFWAETVITALPSVSIKDQNYSVIIHDITSRKKLDELKSEFISIITHELQTPISIMRIIVENVLKYYSKTQSFKVVTRTLRDLDGEINRLGLLIENVLDIAKLRTKKFSLKLQDFDLTLLTRVVANKMQLVAENKPIIVHPFDKVFISADKVRIEQVIMNLLDNAIKYTPTMGEINIHLKVVKTMAIVSIQNETDIDRVIPKNKYLFIFDKFYQLTDKPVKGLGLGLYISREIIKQHKGKIWVSTDKNNRNIFHFSLPVKQQL